MFEFPPRHSLQSLLQRIPPARSWAYLYVICLLLAVFYHHFIIDYNNPEKCESVLNSGKWYEGHTWLTPGCVTERYGSRFTRDCLVNRRAVFAGDESLEPLYWATVQNLDHDVNPHSAAGRDLHFSKDGVEFEYLWDPYLNGSKLLDDVFEQTNGTATAPALVVVGTRHRSDAMTFNDFSVAIDNIVATASLLGESNRNSPLRLDQEHSVGNLLLFAPVQEPYHEVTESTPVPHRSDSNEYLKEQADMHGLHVLWSFDEMTRGRKDAFMDDGKNVRWDVTHQMADVVLSLRCNGDAARTRSFPNIRTCCGTWKSPNWVQTTFLLFGVVVMPLINIFDYLRPTLSATRRQILRSTCAFTLVISLQYVTDRTHIFEQVQRLPLRLINLQCMLAIAAFIGLISIRRCSAAKKPNMGTELPASLPFLPRDQTDEMKGWMQLLIIFYHYNMAWTFDRYWEIIRLAVASYLFLTGFGHTVYFLQKQDYSFRRVAAVLLRTNLLPCTLAYVMRTRWLLYYYMPLSTFWFLVVYATLAIGCNWNTHKLFVVAKIIISAALVHAFITTRDLPETVVRFFAITCKMSFDANAFFHHRVQMDQYIVYVGMAVAMFYLWSKEALSSDSQTFSVQRMFRRFFLWINVFTVVGSLLIMIGFLYYAYTHIQSQSEWSALQPYITFIPILSFLVLRNAHPILRNFHSAAFAWLGRYSGEMYVMQDHIWLAGDQEAVLRTGFFHGDETVPNDRWRDLVLITPFYLIACAIVGDATAAISTWLTAEHKPAIGSVPSDREQPTDEVEMSLLAHVDGEVGDESTEKWAAKPTLWQTAQRWHWPRLWPSKIHSRMLLILGMMWVMNVTYN